MKRKNYNLMIGGAITLFFLAVALIGQFWTPYGTTTMDSMAVNLAPCAAHPLGTDNFGRDILSRVMAGSGSTFFVAVCTVLIGCVFGTIVGKALESIAVRLFTSSSGSTFFVAVCTVLIGCVFGTIVGALTGYFGGFFDNLIMRFNDILLSFPSILLALIFISLTKPGSYNIILALGILFIPSFARIVRSEVIRCRELDFVKSARILGAGHIRIIFAHILPNAAVSLLTAAAIGFNNAVLAEASMSYLGLGIQPPEPSLGRMLYEAQSYLFNAPWYAIGPGVTIILIILGFSMVSEGLRSMQQ